MPKSRTPARVYGRISIRKLFSLTTTISSGESYLANLSLYPRKSELPLLPSNTQAVLLQPLEKKGIATIGSSTIRGFTTSDQARAHIQLPYLPFPSIRKLDGTREN